MATVTRENIGLLHDKVLVKVHKEDYLPAFEKKIKEYSKTANIPGFRKGMVPVGMVKKMYGTSIFNDEVLKTVEKELYNYLNTEKPQIFAQPLPLNTDLKELDINNPADYEFGFEMGLKPNYTLPNFATANATLHKVICTDEMVTDEINRMQIKGGEMKDLETITSEECVLNVLFKESMPDGSILVGGIQKENSVIVKYLTAGVQKNLMGKKIGDNITIQLNSAFEKDKLEAIVQDLGFEPTDTAAAEKYFVLEIAKIGLVEKRALDETFFKEIYPTKDIKTEDELKINIKEEIQQYWDAQSRNQLHDQLYHFLIDETKMDFPEPFLKKWLQTGGEKPKTEEQAEEEFPAFSNQLKWTLISDQIVQDNKLQVTNEELRESMKAEVMRYFGTMQIGDDTSWLESYIDRMMKDEKQTEASYRRLVTEKLFSFIEQQTTPKEKISTVEALTALQHNHQH
jgi:trigger factor